MKKLLTALAILLCCMFTLAGCEFPFGGSSNGSSSGDNSGSNNTPASSTVTIYFGDASSTYTIKKSGYAEIYVLAGNSGKMIEGIYDSQSGGTKYFDVAEDGSYFTNLNPWNTSNPSTYYAHYSDAYTSYTSSTIKNEDPSASISGAYRLDKRFIKTIMENPDATVTFNFTFQATDASWGVWSYVAESNFYVGTKDKKEKIAGASYSQCSSSWETKTESGTASGQLILNRSCSVYVSLSSRNAVGYDMGKFKNLKYSASIAL